jgi:hypothetical protein
MNTATGTIYTFGIHGHRAITRTTRPLFPSGALQWITAQAAHYATVEGPEAMRFAIGLAGLAYSSNAMDRP